jgi:hypothetical protein
MTDQEIMDLWNECRVNGDFTVSAAALSFARALLASSASDKQEVVEKIPTRWQKAQMAFGGGEVLSDKSASDAQPKNAPFANCQFRECDLPGQCRSEGKCHHPTERPAAADSEGVRSTDPRFWNVSTAFSSERSAADDAQPVAVNLEGLRAKLLAPREIKRDEDGWLTHPDYPVCDEGTHAGKFLEAFGIEVKFVSMDSDDPEGAERYFEAGEPDCSYWTPTQPAGDGWILLEIYDTEDGPYAMFGRDAYEVEQARKREHTRKLADAVRERRVAAIAKEPPHG